MNRDPSPRYPPSHTPKVREASRPPLGDGNKKFTHKKCKSAITAWNPYPQFPPPKSLMIKMSLYQFIAGVADDGFRTGWSGPTDPRFPDTCAKRHVMAARLGFSTGKGKKTAVNSFRNGGPGGSQSCPRDAKRTPLLPAPKKKKMPGERVLETGGSFPSSFFLFFVLYWQEAAEVCCCCSTREIRNPVVSSAPS